MYSPIGQNSTGVLDQGPQKEKNCCCNTFCWIFQILTWGALIASIVLVLTDGIPVIFPVFAVLYIVYLILEFCSPTAKYLCNKSSDLGMYHKMGKLFQTPPEINFHCECYHMVTRIHTSVDKDGHVNTYTTTEKVVTYREIYKLPYYSARDVSGLFYLNCERANIEKKYYIKLELKEEINFADAISVYDYEKEKSEFWKRNRFRDVFFNFWETRTISGMKYHNLIKLVPKEPCMVNFFWFFFFTFFTFGEFYKLYFESVCIYQRFKVRKLVSTRYDLNQPVYQEFVPQIDLISEQYKYEQDYYNYKNDNYDVQLPTQEELEAAKPYQDKVPNYQISSGEGQFQQGVIIDKPGYDFNPNEAPAEFASVSGNVALGQDQISENGAPPPNFGQADFQFSITTNEKTPDSNKENSGAELGYMTPKT